MNLKLVMNSVLSLFLGSLLMMGTSISYAEKIEYSLPDIDGVKRNLSDYRGKWVVLNFWATWCPPCLKEIPELVDFHDEHKNKDAIVIGVAYEDIKSEELQEFVDSYFMNYPILVTSPTSKTPFGVISGLPSTFLISPTGELVATQTGPVTAKLITDFINKQKPSETKSSAMK